ncbi:MAG: DUF3142 domain-containing protein [Lysobacteraceae bacterium]
MFPSLAPKSEFTVRFLAFLVLAALLLLAGCSRSPENNGAQTAASDSSGTTAPALTSATAPAQRSTSALPQAAYIWQRVWTPAHRGVLANSHELFNQLRVLAAQLQPGEGWFDAHVDLQALQVDGRAVRPVIRLDGRLSKLDAADIAQRSSNIVSDWRAAGVHVDGIEIDFDCPSARLPEYAQLLSAVRAALPRDVQLSITALPDWIDASGLLDVLAIADEAVLQVHAVRDPAQGLFDADKSEQWIARFASRTERPFEVALPAYGSALVFDRSGQRVGVESEAGLAQAGERQELNADPAAVAALLRKLEAAPPPHLRGIVWFRLPLPGDRRAWALATMSAVINAQPLRADFVAAVQSTGTGAFDLQVANRGTLDARLPASVDIGGRGCGDADALPGYRIQRAATGLRFVRESDARLPASQSRALGWVRCTQLADPDIHVHP